MPQWAEDHQVAGALARLPVPTRQLSEATVKQRARELLEHPTRLPTADYWLAHRRQTWPPTLVRWPEERVRALTFFMRVNQVINIEDGVALFETVETGEELTLARWLTKSLIRVIDGEHQRDLWKWFNILDFMRATHVPRT